MSEQPQVEEGLVCDQCGRFDAIEVGEFKLCPDCHANSGAGCAGGGDDSAC